MALLCGHIIGQNCVRNISTKWDSAHNTELSSFLPLTNPWINTFNLGRNNGAAFYSIPINTGAGWHPGVPSFMPSPFVAGPSEYAYLYEPALGSVHDKDYHWEDGWEVMWLNLGYYPNGEKIDSLNPNRIVPGPDAPANNKVPYIIMYNRYTGKLRIFANLVTGFNSYHGVRMKILHPSAVEASGMFRHMANYDQPLDQVTEIRRTASANLSNINNNNVWMSTDFQLGYDPCICQYPSTIDFRLNTVKHYNVNLLGRSVSANFPVSAIDSPAYSNFLTNEGLRENFNGGSVLYKSFSGMLDDYDKELEAYNTKLNSYNAPFNSVLRDVLKAAKDGASQAGATFVAKPMGDFFLRQLVKIDGATKKDTTTADGWEEEVSKSAKGQLGKAFDFISMAALGDDFTKEPQRPSMPTATFSEMRFAGTIDDSAEVFVVNWLTPGSYKYPQVPSAFNYPAYNEVPGLYALLRKPVVKGFEDKRTVRTILTSDTIAMDTTVSGSTTIIDITTLETSNWDQSNKLFLRVNEPLKYKLNHALDFDFDKTKLYVSFVVELENNLPNGDNCFTLHLTQNNDEMYLRDVLPIQGTTSYKLFYESTWQNIEDIGDVLFKMDFKNSFQPISQRRNTIVMTNIDTSFIEGPVVDCVNMTDAEFTIKKIKMKVAADMYFDQLGSNGLQNNNFQTFTYLLYDPANEIDLISHATDSSEVQRMKQPDLVLTNETIEPTDPFVFETIGNTIFVNARNIDLNGTITVASGFTAVLQATGNIRGISGTTTLGRDIRFKNVSGFSPFGKNYEATQTETDNFCTSQNDGYKANLAQSKWGGEETEEEPQQAETKIQTLVYPNPANDVVNVSISATDEQEYSFQVYDIMGRALINEQVSGANQPVFEINTSALSGGTYFLRITTPDGVISETHRLVIVR